MAEVDVYDDFTDVVAVSGIVSVAADIGDAVVVDDDDLTRLITHSRRL